MRPFKLVMARDFWQEDLVPKHLSASGDSLPSSRLLPNRPEFWRHSGRVVRHEHLSLEYRHQNRVAAVLIADWEGAGLPKASRIKPVLATIEQHLILRKLGALQPDDAEAVRSTLRQILG
jgi:hypothetical protein